MASCLDHLELLGLAETTTAGDHDGGLVELGTVGLLDETVDHRGRAGGAEIGHGERRDRGGTATGRLGGEGLGPHQEDAGLVAGERGA